MLAQKEAIRRLREECEKDGNILLAYLFGSKAKGTASQRSDYDVAVLLRDNDLTELGAVLFAISKSLGVFEDEIDLVDLSLAPLALKARVLREGIKLIDRGYEEELVKQVNMVYPELVLESEKELRWWSRNPHGIDKELVRHLVGYMSLTSVQLKPSIQKYSKEELETDPEAWHATKSMVQDIIQAMIDVLAHVASAHNLGAVSAYREYVEKLVSARLMGNELAELCKASIVVRNRLIHRYILVTPDELLAWSKRLVEELTPQFVQWASGLGGNS